MRLALWFVAWLFVACTSRAPEVVAPPPEDTPSEDPTPEPEAAARENESTRPPAQTVTVQPTADPMTNMGDTQYDFESDDENAGALQLDE